MLNLGIKIQFTMCRQPTFVDVVYKFFVKLSISFTTFIINVSMKFTCILHVNFMYYFTCTFLWSMPFSFIEIRWNLESSKIKQAYIWTKISSSDISNQQNYQFYSFSCIYLENNSPSLSVVSLSSVSEAFARVELLKGSPASVVKMLAESATNGWWWTSQDGRHVNFIRYWHTGDINITTAKTYNI